MSRVELVRTLDLVSSEDRAGFKATRELLTSCRAIVNISTLAANNRSLPRTDSAIVRGSFRGRHAGMRCDVVRSRGIEAVESKVKRKRKKANFAQTFLSFSPKLHSR